VALGVNRERRLRQRGGVHGDPAGAHVPAATKAVVMAALAPTLIRLDPQSMPVDPPGECPVWHAAVPSVASDITARAKPGKRNGDSIDLLVSVASFAVTAQPCGHVLRAWRKDDDA